MKLRSYQEKTINSLIYLLKKGNEKILLELPTGAGKTVIATHFIKKCLEWNKKVVFCVNREELVIQTYKHFFNLLETKISVLKAGADYKGLFNSSFAVQIISLQTYYSRKPEIDCDILIIDEVHQGYNSLMMNLLIESLSPCKIIGMSATPISEKGYLLDGFDNYINSVSVSELVEQNYLSKPITYTPDYCLLDLEKISISNNDYNNFEVDSIVIDLDKVKNIIKAWKELAKDKKTLIFGNSIAHCELLYSEFKKAFPDEKIIMIHSKTPDLYKKRKEVSKHNIIINCGILTTGFDDPDIECILLARPTKILRLWLQMIGRGLRKTKNKKECIIIDCGNTVRQHGLPEDYREYISKPKKENELLYKECPECGTIVSINASQCTYCEYLFNESSLTSSKKSKKELEKLIIAKSIQQECLESLRAYVIERGYRKGYAFYLIKELARLHHPSLSNFRYWKIISNKIKNIIKKNYKPYAVVYKVKERIN